MSRNNEQTEAFKTLLLSDEEQLYEELGLRSQAMSEDYMKAGQLNPEISYDITVMGPLDNLRKIGIRLFNRWNKETYKLLCTVEEDAKIDRDELLKAFAKDEAAVAALLCPYLVSWLGLAPAIAAVIVTIALKRYFRPAYEELCESWKESFEEE